MLLYKFIINIIPVFFLGKRYDIVSIQVRVPFPCSYFPLMTSPTGAAGWFLTYSNQRQVKPPVALVTSGRGGCLNPCGYNYNSIVYHAHPQAAVVPFSIMDMSEATETCLGRRSSKALQSD